MGTILAFPADARARHSERRGGMTPGSSTSEMMGKLMILPVIRIERYDEAPTTDRGPEEGAPRRRRRRARS